MALWLSSYSLRPLEEDSGAAAEEVGSGFKIGLLGSSEELDKMGSAALLCGVRLAELKTPGSVLP